MKETNCSAGHLKRFVVALLTLSASQVFALNDWLSVFPRFEDYEVQIYDGAIQLPEWIRNEDGRVWRNEAGKQVYPPQINFAGKYYIAAHSCGTSCRSYTLTDLSEGRDLDVLHMFVSAEPRPVTPDGHPYIVVLLHYPSSRMLVAQYLVELGQGNDECRERAFLFENENLMPITDAWRICRE